MKIKILLNGVGRIGKAILRILIEDERFQIVAINEINPHINNIVYSINYDSTYKRLKDKFIIDKNHIKNSKHKIKIYNQENLKNIDFKEIDYIIDASGKKEDIKVLESLDVKAIFLSHPNKNAHINVIMGVNEQKLNKKLHKIISTSSCNATALLPVLNQINKHNKIICGDIQTIHPLLNHQRVLDGHYISSETRDVDCNFEFGRSATQNIIPTKTTTVTACSYIDENINSNILSSSSLRVPTSTVGSIAVTLFLEKSTSKEEIVNIFKEFEKKQKLPIIMNNFDALVSSDFEQEEHTSIIDHRFTEVKSEKMLKLLLWYDNEWGYSTKLIEILKYFDDLE